MIEACGTEQPKYVERKLLFLKTVGYEERPFELQVNLEAESGADLVDAFLGSKPLKASGIKTSQTRFGIKLPHFEEKEGIFQIKPGAVDKGIMSFRGKGATPPATFKFEMFFPAIPNLPKELHKYLFRSKFFNIEITNTAFSILPNNEVLQDKQKLDDLIQFLNYISIVNLDTSTLVIKPKRFSPISIPLPRISDNKFSVKSATKLLESFYKLRELFQLAASPEPEFYIEDIRTCSNRIVAVKKLLDGVPLKSPFRFETEVVAGIELSTVHKFIFFDYIKFPELYLAFYGLVDLVPKKIHQDRVFWESVSFDSQEIRVVKNMNEYDDFVEQAKINTSVLNTIVNRFDPESDQQA